MTARHAEIAGGGIGGLTAAAALAQRGWSVVVHERDADLRTYGAGIFVWENGLRVLEAIGAFDEAVAGAHPAEMRETRDARNRLIGAATFKQERGGRLFTIVRAQLLRALQLAAERHGVEIRTGSAAVAARREGVLVLANGEERRADLVVAADGINSPIRDGLSLLARRTRLRDGAIRLLIPRRPEERESQEGRKYYEYWSGTRRLLYVPCSADQVYIALTCLVTDEDGRALPIRRASWHRSFPHLAPVIDRIGDQGRWDPFEVVQVRQWSAGRVALVGDACYAQAPNLGQGGGCAMMAGLALAATLEHAGSVEDGLREWERRERPLIDHCQRFSSFYGTMTTWPPRLRAITLQLMHRWPWFNAQRTKAARHVPTGASRA